MKLLTRYLSLSSVNSNRLEDCSMVPNLNDLHVGICRDQPRIIRTVGLGMQKAVDECQRQFQRDRWNCPTMSDDATKTVFGRVLDRGKT